MSRRRDEVLVRNLRKGRKEEEWKRCEYRKELFDVMNREAQKTIGKKPGSAEGTASEMVH